MNFFLTKLGKLLKKLHKNMSTQNILDFGHRNLGFEPGTSDLFDRFFGTFLVKKMWSQNDGIH
jgi:hypothetical protein